MDVFIFIIFSIAIHVNIVDPDQTPRSGRPKRVFTVLLHTIQKEYWSKMGL